MRIWQTVRKTLGLMPDGAKRGLASVIGVSLLAAGLETLSVAFIFPFLAVAMDPSVTEWAWQLQLLQQVTGITETRSFQIFLGVVVLVLVVVANLAGAFAKWFQARFEWRMLTAISQRLMDLYLRQPYTYHIQRNPAHMRASAFEYVDQVMAQALRSFVELVRAAATITGIFVVLLAVRPLISTAVAAFFGLSYFALTALTRMAVNRHGETMRTSSEERNKVGVQAFQGIKEVKFFGVEQLLVSEAKSPTYLRAKSIGLMSVYSQVPFHVLQIIAFGGLMGVFIVLLVGLESLDSIVPTLGFFAFAGYRMLPAFQGMFAGMTNIRGGAPIVQSLHDDLTNLPERPHQSLEDRLPLNADIVFENVGFTYHGKSEPALAEINAEISRSQTVAFVGHSGSGKTTLLDIMLGLIPPTCGQVLIDGTTLTKSNALAWRLNIGYVPQDVTLHDMSIAENIGFGVSKSDIDMERVRQAAQLANLADFIEGDLPEEYDTMVGDRGIRLSGGQRQRVGIARALYRNPDVIVFDEATSSLDSITEREITKSIQELGGKKTIVLVAHRLTTVMHCDTIFVMDGGRIVSQGTYDELLESDPHFRALAMEHDEEEEGDPRTRLD